MSMISWMILNDSILDKQPAIANYITTQLASEVGHGFSCFVCYVEHKIAPTDAIWLFSLYTDD